jgi:hypothetical protein
VKKKLTCFKVLKNLYHFSGQFDLTYSDISSYSKRQFSCHTVIPPPIGHYFENSDQISLNKLVIVLCKNNFRQVIKKNSDKVLIHSDIKTKIILLEYQAIPASLLIQPRQSCVVTLMQVA